MRERLETALTRMKELETSEAAQKFMRTDRAFGRAIGAAKAFAWTVTAVGAFLTGQLIVAHADGWIAFTAAVVSAALVFYAAWRAYRGLFHARRASEVIADEIVDRVKPMEQALGFAGALSRRLTGRKSPIEF